MANIGDKIEEQPPFEEKGNLPSFSVTEIPSSTEGGITEGGMDTNPQPENFYSENLQPPLVAEVTPVNTGFQASQGEFTPSIGYSLNEGGDNPASEIVKAKVGEEPIPSRY